MALAPFQMLNSHVWPMTTILERVGLGARKPPSLYVKTIYGGSELGFLKKAMVAERVTGGRATA